MNNKKFLDTSCIDEFNKTLWKEMDILYNHDRFKNVWNRLNSIIRKIRESTKQINKLYLNISNEDEISTLILNFSILKDSISTFIRILGIKLNKNSEYFKNCFWWHHSYSNKINDESFFSFIRAVFVHPTNIIFNENRMQIMSKNQIFIYSSINFNVENDLFACNELKKYNNLVRIELLLLESKEKNLLEKSENVFVFFELNWLYNYIKHWFSFLKEINKILGKQIKETKKQVNIFVDKNKSKIEQFDEIKEILQKRYQSTYKLEKVIQRLKTNSTFKQNERFIEEYKKYLFSFLPKIKKEISKFKFEYYEIDDLFNFSMYCAKDIINDGQFEISYLVSKVYDYIDNENKKTIKNTQNIEELYFNKQLCSNEEWGLSCLKVLYLIFKKNKKTNIILNFEKMEYDELILLMETIIYLEWNDLRK